MADFTSNDNKSILWDILSEQNLFEGIDTKYKYEIKDTFEQTILLVEKQGRGLSLIEKNKDVIKNMVVSLGSFKRQQQPETASRQYTNEELHKERQKAFERELKRKQTEFDGLNRTMPEKIDFSDKADEKLGERIDSLLAETIASRERELKQVLQIQTPEIAVKWIENGNGISNFDDAEPIKNLKIGEEAHIQETQIVNLDRKNQRVQKVSFNDDKNNTLNYSTESAPISINREREILNNNVKIKIDHKDKDKPDDIGFNFFKMLKTEESTESNEQNNNFNLISKEDIHKINNNNIDNGMRLDIENLKKELVETNKSVDLIHKSIDSINIKQEEILFILKTFISQTQNSFKLE
jgi:hypothetical protein